MAFVSKLSPEQWAEARRLRAGGATYTAIAAALGVNADLIAKCARREGWSARGVGNAAAAATAARSGATSPGTAGIRSRLALRLYRVIECKIKMMELRMIKELQAYEQAGTDGTPPPTTNDERESFAALIDSINRVTEIASEPAPAPAGKRRAASGPINPELTALSTDIDPDGLAIASEKDQYRREIAEHLGRMFPKP
jgi:hypothetical protein